MLDAGDTTLKKISPRSSHFREGIENILKGCLIMSVVEGKKVRKGGRKCVVRGYNFRWNTYRKAYEM